MSQVRKYAPGGAISSNTFTYAGDQYNRQDFLNLVIKNKDAFLMQAGYTPRERELFNLGYEQLIPSLLSSNFSKTPTGKWINVGELSNSGERDKNMFGKSKKTDNNALGFATSLLDYTLQTMPKYLSKLKSEYKLDILKDISNKYFGGNNIDYRVWELNDALDEITKIRGNTNRARLIADLIRERIDSIDKDFDSKYTINPTYRDKADMVNRLLNLSVNLKDGKLDDLDYISAASIGLSKDTLDKLMGNYISQEEQLKQQEEQQKLAEQLTLQKLEQAKLAAMTVEQREAYLRQKELSKYKEDRDNAYILYLQELSAKYTPTSYFPYDESLADTNDNILDLDASTIASVLYGDRSFKNPMMKDINTILYNYMRNINNPNKKYSFIPKRKISGVDNSNQYILTELYNEANNNVPIYDANNKLIIFVNASEVPEIQELLREMFNSQYDRNNATTLKSGGVLKFLGGGFTDFINKKNGQEKIERQYNVRQVQLPTPTKGNENGDKDNFQLDWRDYTRLGSIAADIVSMVSANAPVYGTVVSAASGLTSTAANAVADFTDDDVSTGKALSNLGIGLGADILGLIPGLGVSAKATKISKVLAPILTIFVLYEAVKNAFKTAPGAASAAKKVLSGEANKITNDEWMDLANLIKFVVSGGKTLRTQGINVPIVGRVVNPSRKHMARIDELDNAHQVGRRVNDTRHGTVGMKEEDYLQMTGIKDPVLGVIPRLSNITKSKQKAAIDELNLDFVTDLRYGIGPFSIRADQYSYPIDPDFKYNNFVERRRYNYGVKPFKDVKPKTKLGTPDQTLEKYTKLRTEGNYSKDKADIDVLSDLRNKSKISSEEYDQLIQLVKSNKNGGVIKASNGTRLVPKHDNGKVMTRNSNFLNVKNTFLNALNTTNWYGYYDNAKLLDRGIQSKWKGTNLSLQGINLLTQMLNNRGVVGVNQTGYKDFNDLFNTNFTDYNTHGYGYDASKSDMMGPTTYNRQALIREMIKRFNSPENYMNFAGTKIYYDGQNWVEANAPLTTRAISLPSLISTDNDPSASTSIQTPTNTEGVSGFDGARTNRSRLNIRPEDLIAAERMIGTVVTNNNATRKILDNMKSTLLNTYENYIPLIENYMAKASADRQATNLEHEGRRIALETSDGALGAAARLSANRQAADLRFQGDLANELRVHETGMLSRQESNAAKARRTEVANQNKAGMNVTALAKAQLKSSNQINNWQNAILPWLAGIEQNYRQSRVLENQNNLAASRALGSLNYNLLAAIFGQLYLKGEMSAAEYQRRMSNLLTQTQLQMSRDNSLYNNYDWMFYRKPRFANGGKLSDKARKLIAHTKNISLALNDSNKLFFREIDSLRKISTDLTKQLSAFTAKLISAGMKI